MMGSIGRFPILAGALAVLLLAGCSETKLANPSSSAVSGQTPRGYKVGKPYQVAGVWYYPKVDYDYDETGIASWYGPGFHGQYTANGEIYDQNGLTAAHKTLPLPSMVRVTNLENGRSIVVRVNDRGPFSNGRIIDMTRRGAQLLGFIGPGTARVRVQILKEDSQVLAAQASSQGGEGFGPKPVAAPSGVVTATPLPPPGKAAAGQIAANPPPANPVQANPVPPAPIVLQGKPPQGAVPFGQAPQTAQPPQTTPLPQAAPAPQVAQLPQKSAIGNMAEPQPDGQVSIQPVHATNIFIQAGAFSRQSNAQLLTTKLARFGTVRTTPVYVGNQLFYRVRLGPVANVDQADQVLQKVIQSGNPEARIVVE